LTAAVRPLLTVGGTIGKGNKVPQTGRSAGATVIAHESGDGGRRLTMQSRLGGGDPSIGVTTNGLLVFRAPVPPTPFRPRLAYKALVKMGLGLLPVHELPAFEGLRHWERVVPPR
jgi:hypothetical protein